MVTVYQRGSPVRLPVRMRRRLVAAGLTEATEKAVDVLTSDKSKLRSSAYSPAMPRFVTSTFMVRAVLGHQSE